jgi:hypothetical protein
MHRTATLQTLFTGENETEAIESVILYVPDGIAICGGRKLEPTNVADISLVVLKR